MKEFVPHGPTSEGFVLDVPPGAQQNAFAGGVFGPSIIGSERFGARSHL